MGFSCIADKKIPLNWGPDGLTAHVVNNAMAIKYPGLWYQQSGDERFKNAVFDGIEKYDLNHGQAGGRFSGDEHLSGNSPDSGTELCSVVEYMFSLEELYAIFGDNSLADRLEFLDIQRIARNNNTRYVGTSVRSAVKPGSWSMGKKEHGAQMGTIQIFTD